MEASKKEPHKAKRGQETTLVGIGINVGLVLIKGTAGLLGHSYAMVADAMESATDIVTPGFVWVGLRTASKIHCARSESGHPGG